MKPSFFLAFMLAAFLLVCGAQSADEDRGLGALDTRTRCIVLLREALVHLQNQNVKQVLPILADGRRENEFVAFSPEAIKAMSAEEEKEFMREFPQHDVVFKTFDRILFSDLSVKTERATLKKTEGEAGQPAKVYVIKVRIPELSEEEFREIRFIESGERLYWVPFGW